MFRLSTNQNHYRFSFRVEMSVDGINGQSIQTISERRKRLEVIVWNSGYLVYKIEPLEHEW